MAIPVKSLVFEPAFTVHGPVGAMAAPEALTSFLSGRSEMLGTEKYPLYIIKVQKMHQDRTLIEHVLSAKNRGCYVILQIKDGPDRKKAGLNHRTASEAYAFTLEILKQLADDDALPDGFCYGNEPTFHWDAESYYSMIAELYLDLQTEMGQRNLSIHLWGGSTQSWRHAVEESRICAEKGIYLDGWLTHEYTAQPDLYADDLLNMDGRIQAVYASINPRLVVVNGEWARTFIDHVAKPKQEAAFRPELYDEEGAAYLIAGYASAIGRGIPSAYFFLSKSWQKYKTGALYEDGAPGILGLAHHHFIKPLGGQRVVRFINQGHLSILICQSYSLVVNCVTDGKTDASRFLHYYDYDLIRSLPIDPVMAFMNGQTDRIPGLKIKDIAAYEHAREILRDGVPKERNATFPSSVRIEEVLRAGNGASFDGERTVTCPPNSAILLRTSVSHDHETPS